MNTKLTRLGLVCQALVCSVLPVLLSHTQTKKARELDVAWTLHQGVAMLLLNAYMVVDVEARTLHGQTALHCAAQQGHADIVRVFLAQPQFTQINAKTDVTEETALHEAASFGHVAVTELLLRDPRCRHQRSRHGRTALHLAALSGHVDVVGAFLQECPTGLVSRPCARGHTALHCAVDKGHCEVTRLLMMHRSFRVSVMDRAEDRGHVLVARMLSRHQDMSLVGTRSEVLRLLDLARSRGHSEVRAFLEGESRAELSSRRCP